MRATHSRTVIPDECSQCLLESRFLCSQYPHLVTSCGSTSSIRRKFTPVCRVRSNDGTRWTVQPGPGGDPVTRDGRNGHSTTEPTGEDRVAAGEEDQWLVALCGLPGVGKSTVAGYVTEQLDAVRLRTDVVRKELFDEPQYTAEETESVYRELSRRAGDALAASESVVLDATFANATHREDARELAARHGVGFRLIEVVCDQAIAEQRIATRDDVSDADVDVYRRFQDEFDPVEGEHVVVDNSGSKVETYRQLDTLF